MPTDDKIPFQKQEENELIPPQQMTVDVVAPSETKQRLNIFCQESFQMMDTLHLMTKRKMFKYREKKFQKMIKFRLRNKKTTIYIVPQ